MFKYFAMAAALGAGMFLYFFYQALRDIENENSAGRNQE